MSLEPIDGILKGFYQRRPSLKKGLSRGVIWKKWEELLGRPISENAWPECILQNDVLLVRCTDPIWSQQLFMEQESILEILNRHLPPNGRLSGIRFKVGDVEELKKRKKTHSKRNALGTREKIPKELSDEADLLVKGVKDPELRDGLKRLYIAYRQRLKRL